MAEIEVHPGHHHDDNDPVGKRVGFQVGLIGILLAVVTIAAHRQHTDAVIHRTEANDEWGYYQAKKVREHVSAVGEDIVALIDPSKVDAAKAHFGSQRARYLADAEGIKQQAEARDRATDHAEALALRFDIGEGLLELGLVLSSLYFLGRRKIFPLAGLVSAVAGLLVSLSALLI
ncbi:MAG: hypothetical protein RLZZ393_173 [Pseudomonadota bacterium]|jgi:hypothetical protein